MIRLLIIDDHEMVREGLKAMLTTEPDFTIVGDAANAEQAFELIERLRPDVILLDIRLPGTSGIDVCRTVTERYPEAAVIILTTAVTASAAAKKQRVPRSGSQAQAVAPRSAAPFNPYNPALTGAGSSGYNQSLMTWR